MDTRPSAQLPAGGEGRSKDRGALHAAGFAPGWPTRQPRRCSDTVPKLTERPFLLCDWERAVFVHYAVEASVLQPQVPYELDLYAGTAYVSLVAFTMRRLRPAQGGRLSSWLTAPLATHAFFNLRTYVRRQNQPGIYFLAEWVPLRLAVMTARRTFGLPYRFGRLEYCHDPASGRLHGRITAGDRSGWLRYQAVIDPDATFGPAETGTLAEFLLERYIAFTVHRNRRKLFRIGHDRWPQRAIDLTLSDGGLLRATGLWFRQARWVGAHYSPGVRDVWIARPLHIH